MDIYENLNENQKEAVLHTEGPLLILAGAGSGKTRVITHRIAHLIGEKNISPFNIFAVTFTNKAAEEMRNRVTGLIGDRGRNVFIRTFHSASVTILRQFGDRIGIPSSFTIYDSVDQQAVIKEILLNMKIDPKKVKPSMINGKISEVKNKHALTDESNLHLHFPDFYMLDFQEVYKRYNTGLEKQNALDFDDLLIKTVTLFRESPEVLRHLQRKWRYLMVDEYQDTNFAQYLIAKYLASAGRNICVVGDDDQSIYSWRGADIRNILNFENDYNEAKVITLEENYRSTEPILKIASHVIRNNINRKEKNLRAFKGEGEPPVWCETNNEYGEAEYVVNSILSFKNREGLQNSDFAIFYRTNAQSRVFEDFLRKENIPYKIIGGLRFYDRKEIKDILAYLKFIANPADMVSMNRIINTPARGIGNATMDKIKNAAIIKSLTPWKVIEGEHLEGKVPKGIKSFREIIKNSHSLLKDVPKKTRLSDFVNEVIDISGYRGSLKEENSLEANTRLENIDELLNSIIDFEIHNPESGLEHLLQEISLYTSEENPEDDIDNTGSVVTLMTVHNAKGLEFPVVFLSGLEENTFPHKFSMDTEEDIEEERRLFYVGVTRAMERVFLTSSEIRRSYMGVDYRETSRFIGEIPEDLIEMKRFSSGGFSDNGSSPFRERSSGYGTMGKEDYHEKTNPVSDSVFQVKERVLHPKYGMGRVLKIEGSGDNIKLTILFGSTSKVFMEKYTPLEKIS
jgi:DNA helicase-2/ATP-dependent DNA helicase PcrA